MAGLRLGLSGPSGRQMLNVLLVCFVFMDARFFKSASAIKKGDLFPNETKSSPSHVTAARGSSVWLTWGYDYGGDDPGSKEYKEQIIGFNSSSNAALQTVAKRIGPNGALQLEPSIPAPFTGRLQVIPSNSTLVINGLEYNDSAYQFASYVNFDIIIGPSRFPVQFNLKPVVDITVNGVPQFLVSPPASLEVSENSNLEIAIQMDGNPAASADFVWPHSGAAATTVAGSQIHPYVYSAKFTQRNMVASYCGRVLKTTVKNSVGSSLAKYTNVTVLLKLDADPRLQAGKILTDNCVEVKWEKAESGSCYVKYEVKLKNASGFVVYTETGYNIDAMKKCKIPGNVNITDVEMTMSFKSTTKVFTSKVSETPIPTTLPPTTTSKTTTTKETTSPGSAQTTHSLSPGSTASSLSSARVAKPKGPGTGKQTSTPIGAIIGGAFGGLILLILLIVLIIYVKKRSNRSEKKGCDSGEPGFPLQDEDVRYSSAGARQGQTEPYEPTYADPKGPVVYGKLGAGGGRKGPRPTRREDESNYADVKVDEQGYPAVGAMPTSYTDGYGQSRGGSRGERDSGRRVAPDRRAPPPYNDANLDDDGYPVSRHAPPVYAQVNKPKKQR